MSADAKISKDRMIRKMASKARDLQRVLQGFPRDNSQQLSLTIHSDGEFSLDVMENGIPAYAAFAAGEKNLVLATRQTLQDWSVKTA